jgi:uncharacterized protein
MMLTRCRNISIGATVAVCLIGLATVAAADDTPRFYGTWKGTFSYNGQMVTMLSVHDAKGYRNYVVLPSGNQPADAGVFSAARGKWITTTADASDSGTYQFIDNNTFVTVDVSGLKITWKRDTTPRPTPSPGPQPNPSPQSRQKAFVPDPSVSPAVNAAFKALTEKDYNTAWRGLMAEAQKGDANAEAGLGMMLFNHLNPPGTGYYAQAEKWLAASANQGNVHGMFFLAMYYNEVGKNLSGGINPGANNSVSPGERGQAEQKFALSRQWFQRAADKGDPQAMANLAIMVDAGIGGPRDPAYAAQLRAQAAKGVDPAYKKRAIDNHTSQAMTMAWQAGHYADALKTANEEATKGDAAAQALLGKAYYEGVGVARNYSTALYWTNLAVAQKNPDGMFILGLMYEFGLGVKSDMDKAVGLFDEAAALGNRNAQMEAKGMRMQGEADAQQARYAAACRRAGGVTDGPVCSRGGMSIDPY